MVSQSLRPVDSHLVQEFRNRIHSMSEHAKISFNDPLALPWEACAMVSEAMVTSYLDTQVIFAAWQAVLRMVLATTDYDLEMVKQAPIDVSSPTMYRPIQVLIGKQRRIPDQMFAMITNQGPEILAIVEFKRRGIVTGMLSVISKWFNLPLAFHIYISSYLGLINMPRGPTCRMSMGSAG